MAHMIPHDVAPARTTLPIVTLPGLGPTGGAGETFDPLSSAGCGRLQLQLAGS